MRDERISVVGITGDWLPKDAACAVGQADLVVGARRHLDAVAPPSARVVVLDDVPAALDAVAREAGRTCVLASGDPGFFGIVRALAERFGPSSLAVHPAPSSVSLAFARLGLPWDDAVVVSAHGRPVSDAVRRAAVASKAAVLTSPDAPPEAVGRALATLGPSTRPVAVCSRLGDHDEVVELTDVAGLAAGRWDARSVVVLPGAEPVPRRPVLAWGRPEGEFAHRDGMVTKAEVRAVALGKLALPPAGVLWDVGAGSGSVAIECASLAPRLRVLAVERRPDDAARIRSNAASANVAVEVVQGTAPDALSGLPDPDRVFVGGGGTAVLDVVLARLRQGGRVVAAYAALDRAAAGFSRLGQLVQVAVSRGAALPGGGVRLEGENPVFVAWGPAS